MDYYAMMSATFGYATIVLLITAAIVAILYMVSKIIQNKGLESWVSNEVFQCLATALFLFLSVGALTLFTDLVRVFLTEFANASAAPQLADYMNSQKYASQQDEAPHILLAKAYLYSRLDRLYEQYSIMYVAYGIFATGASYCKFFPEAGCLPIYGFKPLSEILASAIQYAYYGFLFIYFQLALIELIKSYFIVAFPAGLALRAFPFTRGLGSFLIASSIAIYFVYPLLLSILLIANMDVLGVKTDEILQIAAHESPSDFLVYYVDAVLSHKPAPSASTGTLPVVGGIAKGLVGGISTMVSSIQFTLLSLVLYPLVAIVGAYSFMHQFAQLMQANVGELGRGIIRLI